MKKLTLLSMGITLLLLLTTMICGLWIHSGQPGDISFHMYCGIASIIAFSITCILIICTFHQQKKRHQL